MKRLAGAAVLLALIVVAVVVVLTRGSGHAAKVSFTGTLALFKATSSFANLNYSSDGGVCKGDSGYSDIDQGTAVTVYDGSGSVVGTTTLGLGTVKQDVACEFRFVATDLPKLDFYQVEVAHRGKVTVTYAQAVANDVAMSLGM